MFAKIYETELGQIVIMKLRNDDTNNPEVKVYFEPEGLGVCNFRFEMPDDTDKNWDLIDELFENFTKENIVEKVKEAIKAIKSGEDIYD